MVTLVKAYGFCFLLNEGAVSDVVYIAILLISLFLNHFVGIAQVYFISRLLLRPRSSVPREPIE